MTRRLLLGVLAAGLMLALAAPPAAEAAHRHSRSCGHWSQGHGGYRSGYYGYRPYVRPPAYYGGYRYVAPGYYGYGAYSRRPYAPYYAPYYRGYAPYAPYYYPRPYIHPHFSIHIGF